MSMKVEIGKRPVFCRGGGRRGARILGSFPSCTRALRTRVGTHSSQGLGCVRMWASEAWKKNLRYRVFNFCRAIPLPCIVSEHRDRCRTPGRSGAARRPPGRCVALLAQIRAHWTENQSKNRKRPVFCRPPDGARLPPRRRRVRVHLLWPHGERAPESKRRLLREHEACGARPRDGGRGRLGCHPGGAPPADASLQTGSRCRSILAANPPACIASLVVPSQEAEAREKAELLLAEMKAAFEKLREDVGPIRAWGSSTDGQLGHRGQRPSLVEIRGILRQVACGGAHTAALTDDGVLYIWGRGNEGQLGLGDLRPRAVPTLMKALGDKQAGTTVLQAACGGAHTLALCDNGEVYAWGLNEEGQLGLGASFGKKSAEATATNPAEATATTPPTAALRAADRTAGPLQGQSTGACARPRRQGRAAHRRRKELFRRAHRGGRRVHVGIGRTNAAR